MHLIFLVPSLLALAWKPALPALGLAHDCFLKAPNLCSPQIELLEIPDVRKTCRSESRWIFLTCIFGIQACLNGT